MSIPVVVVIYLTQLSVLGIHDTHRIAPGKFRFDEDIAYLEDQQTIHNLVSSVNAGDIVPNVEPASGQKQLPTHSHHQVHKNTTGHQDESFTSLSASYPVRRIQSIGYTVDSYPNPATNPGLCLQSSYGVHSMLCDPDGILSETQQIELNDLLRKEREYRIFVALAHTILVPGKESGTQKKFTGQLLSIWADGQKDCILLVYVEDQGKLSIVTNIPSDQFAKDGINGIEDAFQKWHTDIFTSLRRAIIIIEEALALNAKSNAVLYIILLALTIAGCLYLSQMKRKQ